MKIAVCFLALVSLALASPVEVEDEYDWSKITPNNVYVEPINPVDPESVELPGSRIIGGSEVVPNSQGHIVGVVIDGSGFCGGSVISANRVLTAAHCTIRASTVQVRFGAHQVQQTEATQVRITSTNIRNHANYNSATISNDIAVILLTTSVSLNNNIRVVSLAPASSGTFAGSTALLVGWGRTSDASNAISPVLRGVNLSIITNAVCSNSYGSIILASTICTSGVGGVGACNGDSGGPLTVNGVQVGIVSFGSSMCQAGNPTAYARVSAFRAWITTNAGV